MAWYLWARSESPLGRPSGRRGAADDLADPSFGNPRTLRVPVFHCHTKPYATFRDTQLGKTLSFIEFSILSTICQEKNNSGVFAEYRPKNCKPENLQCVDFKRLFRSGLRRFRAEIGNFVTKRRSGRGFWPARCGVGKKGCPGRQDTAECWLKCGTLDVCDTSKSFTNAAPFFVGTAFRGSLQRPTDMSTRVAQAPASRTKLSIRLSRHRTAPRQVPARTGS